MEMYSMPSFAVGHQKNLVSIRDSFISQAVLHRHIADEECFG